ncbi:phage antirepressor KilAC domain-containing protein [Serratia liquefaciens]|uniref:phage antirepressor KilAC domain-containing protein n=1 Tax=Serratia liquefaciens TaxID=614 RepID=UPI003EC4BBE9
MNYQSNHSKVDMTNQNLIMANSPAPGNNVALAGGDFISTDELLGIINKARSVHGEKPVRNNDFVLRVKDELEGDHYETFVVQNLNGTKSEQLRISNDQAVLVGMRESKAVRRSVLEILKQKRGPALPQTLPEALRLAADIAEQKAVLEQKVQEDAPKVAFVDHYVETAGSKSLRATAKVLNMPERAMIDALIRDKVLFRQSGNLLPYASHHHSGNFTVKTGTAEQSGHAFTQTRVTPRGIQWIAERYASELMAS